MKYLLLIWILGPLSFTGLARVPPPLAPVDTVVGEAHITHLLTQGLCAQVAIQSRHQDLAVLTRSQGMAALQEMLTTVITQHTEDFEAFIAKTPGDNTALQRVSIQAVLDLAQTCPAAGKLLTQMGAQMAGVDISQLPPAQKLALQHAAHALCEQLVAANRAHAFSARTAEERIAAYRHAIVSAEFAPYHQALLAAFGELALNDKQQEDTLWKRIDLLMFEECPTYTGQIRVDLGLQRLRADSAATAAPSAATPGAGFQASKTKQPGGKPTPKKRSK